MKKRNLFFALLVMGGLAKTYSQTYKHSFGVNLGATQDGIGAMLNYNYFIQGDNSFAASVLVTDAKYSVQGNKIGYNDFTLNLGYSTPLYSTKNRKFAILLGVGGVVGYEIVNGNKSSTLSNGNLILEDSKTIYGAYSGLDIDYLINDRMTVFIKANEYYHANSDLGKFVPFAGLGLRYYAN